MRKASTSMILRASVFCASVVAACAIAVAYRGADAQAASAPQTADPHARWSDYGGAPDAAQYSSLSQINRSNVSSLRLAWSYPTGDGTNYLFNPLVVDDVMYVLAKNNAVVALDAATGKERWTHENPKGRITTR